MPRGGGARGGGGFRGGGFSGGGFRGGGFRGSPASFRTGSVRSSGRPFGRTGATRMVTRSPSGPYRHTYYGPRRRYYGYWYRPWYRRFWFSPWWAGYYYRPWYYSPAFIGGGFAIAIIIALIILPIFGIALFFPFDNADPSGVVTYRSTEVLYFNEYWYEYEYVEAGNEITYSIQSSPSDISFAIWNQPFENLPRTNKVGSDVDSFNLQTNQYEYYSLFLRTGSQITYEFNSTENIDFFIADGYELYDWNQGSNPSFDRTHKNTTSEFGIYSIQESKDYYLVWYNPDIPGSSTASVNYLINYTAANVIDFSGTPVNLEAEETIQGSYEVTSSGNWYFFVYFDPMLSLEETTTITFDVQYSTGVTAADKWINVQPILIIILIIIVIIIIAAYFARKSQKKAKEKKMGIKTKQKIAEEKIPEKGVSPKTDNCVRCGAQLKEGAKFCHVCGGKVEGRKIVSSTIKTPSDSKICAFCGSSIKSSDNYCKYCGTKIEK